MKVKCLFTWVMALVMFCANAQEPVPASRIREVHLGLSSFSPVLVQARYKCQLKRPTVFFRAGLLNLMFSRSYLSQPGTTSHSNQYGGGAQAGLEFRRAINDKVLFYHGPNLGLDMNVSETTVHTVAGDQKSSTAAWNGGVIYALGMMFSLKNQFYFTAELAPGVFYGGRSGSSNYTIYAGFSSTYGTLGLAYRF